MEFNERDQSHIYTITVTGQDEGMFSRGDTILQILDSIQFSILKSRFDSILDFYIYLFFSAQVAMPFLD